MRYVIRRGKVVFTAYMVRNKEDNFIAAVMDSDSLSEEILEYIERDGYVEVSFKLHFGEKE